MATISTQSQVPDMPLVSPLPVRGRQRRWGGAASEVLEAAGYEEQEFLLTGAGNVYAYGDDGKATAFREGVPYTTSALVRYPADPSRFSGNVLLEAQHRAAPHGMMCGMIWETIVAEGDAWVQFVPGPFAARSGPLAVDERRYGSLNLTDEGQIWDIYAQLGLLLKCGGASAPLGHLDVTRLYMAGVSGTGLLLLAFLGEGFDRRFRMKDGAAIYDGYLPYAAHGALNYTWLRSPRRGVNGAGELHPHPSEQIPWEDARRTVRGHDAPVIQVLTETEVLIPLSPPPIEDMMINMYDWGRPAKEEARLIYRREDSDDPEDLYRLYEVPGSSHDNSMATGAARMKGLPEPPRIVMGRPRRPTNNYPVEYVLGAAYSNLCRWGDDRGAAAPKADRVTTDGLDVVRDEFGNALGGVRSPFLDVPIAGHWGVNPGAALMGRREAMSQDQIRDLYTGRADYLEKVKEHSQQLVDENWLRADQIGDVVEHCGQDWDRTLAEDDEST